MVHISWLKKNLKRFGFLKPSSGLFDLEKKHCLNNDGHFFLITGEEKVCTEKDS